MWRSPLNKGLWAGVQVRGPWTWELSNAGQSWTMASLGCMETDRLWASLCCSPRRHIQHCSGSQASTPSSHCLMNWSRRTQTLNPDSRSRKASRTVPPLPQSPLQVSAAECKADGGRRNPRGWEFSLCEHFTRSLLSVGGSNLYVVVVSQATWGFGKNGCLEQRDLKDCLVDSVSICHLQVPGSPQRYSPWSVFPHPLKA